MTFTVPIWGVVVAVVILISILSGRFVIKSFGIGEGGPHLEFTKNERKNREQVRLLNQALELQKEITIAKEKEMLERHMMIAEEEVNMVRGTLSGAYQECMMKHGIEADDVISHDDYHYYQLLWDKLEIKLHNILKKSFIYNGFHTMESNTSEFSDYINDKYNFIWLMSKDFWDKNYKSSSVVHRCEVKEISMEHSDSLKKVLTRIYTKAQDVEKLVNEKVKEKEDLLKLLQKDMQELGV